MLDLNIFFPFKVEKRNKINLVSFSLLLPLIKLINIQLNLDKLISDKLIVILIKQYKRPALKKNINNTGKQKS